VEWVLARWVTFVGTTLVIGVCAVALGILPRVGHDRGARELALREVARIGVVATLTLVPAAVLRMLDQLRALQSPGDQILAGYNALLFSTTWGTGFLTQCVGIFIAGIGMLIAARKPSSTLGWSVAVIGAVALGVTPALQGHAIGSESRTLFAVALDVIHVLSAGVWLGSVAVIGWLGLTLAAGDGAIDSARAARTDARLRLIVPLIPPLALTGALLLLGSGAIATALHLRNVSDIWTSAWGRYALLKSILTAVVVALGALNWKRLVPRLQLSTDARGLRRALWSEVSLAALILLITALLVVTPLPGE
jgi:copper resistance protein D